MTKTKVIFRAFKDHGDIIALFPEEAADLQGNVMSYQRIGQHGAADYNHCVAISRPATPEEFESLKKELESIGYELLIRKRR